MPARRCSGIRGLGGISEAGIFGVYEVVLATLPLLDRVPSPERSILDLWVSLVGEELPLPPDCNDFTAFRIDFRTLVFSGAGAESAACW